MLKNTQITGHRVALYQKRIEVLRERVGRLDWSTLYFQSWGVKHGYLWSQAPRNSFVVKFNVQIKKNQSTLHQHSFFSFSDEPEMFLLFQWVLVLELWRVIRLRKVQRVAGFKTKMPTPPTKKRKDKGRVDHTI